MVDGPCSSAQLTLCLVWCLQRVRPSFETHAVRRPLLAAGPVTMEAIFTPWNIKNIKKVNGFFISQLWLFSHRCKFISSTFRSSFFFSNSSNFFWNFEFTSQNSFHFVTELKKRQFWLFILQFWFFFPKIAFLLKKNSQKSEFTLWFWLLDFFESWNL